MVTKNSSPSFIFYTLFLLFFNCFLLKNNTLLGKNYISLAGGVTTICLAGTISNYLLYTMAARTYVEERHAILYYKPYTPELKEKIVNLVLRRHKKEICESSPYYCFPFIRYIETLNWYIKWLERSSYFNFITTYNSLYVIEMLREIRTYIIQDYRHIQERHEYCNN